MLITRISVCFPFLAHFQKLPFKSDAKLQTDKKEKNISVPKPVLIKAPEIKNRKSLAIAKGSLPFSTENDRITQLILRREEFVWRPLILVLLFQTCNKNVRFHN